jgi:hypothetical protein
LSVKLNQALNFIRRPQNDGYALMRCLRFQIENSLSPSRGQTAGLLDDVPMGGDLAVAPDGKAPSFLIRALRDFDGANLDRIQIVQGLARRRWQDRRKGLRRRAFQRALD